MAFFSAALHLLILLTFLQSSYCANSIGTDLARRNAGSDSVGSILLRRVDELSGGEVRNCPRRSQSAQPGSSFVRTQDPANLNAPVGSTRGSFRSFFPALRNFFIDHGPHNPAVEGGHLVVTAPAAAPDRPRPVVLFFLRIHSQLPLDFSLRRYSRSSGSEICHLDPGSLLHFRYHLRFPGRFVIALNYIGFTQPHGLSPQRHFSFSYRHRTFLWHIVHRQVGIKFILVEGATIYLIIKYRLASPEYQQWQAGNRGWAPPCEMRFHENRSPSPEDAE